ncbi:MAG: hypothetical protein WCY42_04950 [Candidatus Omnitrophota bacterium]
MAKIRKITRAQVIIADLSHEQELIRHDSQKIRDQIAKVIKGRV